MSYTVQGRTRWGWLGVGQGISAWSLVPTELSKVGIHQMEEQQGDPTCVFGCRKNLWGWRGAKIRAGEELEVGM